MVTKNVSAMSFKVTANSRIGIRVSGAYALLKI